MHGERGTEGWITGLSMARVNIAEYAELTRAIVLLLRQRPMGSLVQVMVNKLDAGTALAPHVDGGPDHLRFHLPVITHPLVKWWDEDNGTRVMSTGWWYGPVPYCGKLHSVTNDSPVDRIHVVADFERE